jgi:hypothetical protein
MVISDTVGWTFLSGSLLYTYLQANPKPHQHHPKRKSQKLSTHNQCCAVICLLNNWQFWFFKKFKIKEPLILVFFLGVGDSESENHQFHLFHKCQRTGMFHEITGKEPVVIKVGFWKFQKNENHGYIPKLVFFGGILIVFIYLFQKNI